MSLNFTKLLGIASLACSMLPQSTVKHSEQSKRPASAGRTAHELQALGLKSKARKVNK